MWENGLPKVLTWRWAPCAAFVLGSVSFAAFMLLAIPDRIGQVPAEATTDSLRFQLARTQTAPATQDNWSGDTTNTASATPSLAARPVTGSSEVSAFPKRGFSPPLERPAPPPTPPAPTPMPQQPQLNIPPPVPPPPEQPPGQPEVTRQAESVMPSSDAPPSQGSPPN